MSRPHGRARVDPSFPKAFATCDRCGFWWNRVDLQSQFEFAGTGLRDTGFLFCRPCLDNPQPQLQSRRIPADPPSVLEPRGENFTIDEA